MPRERTDRTSAHSFKRLALLAVVGLALAGLASCGGGGGDGDSPPDPSPGNPTMPVTPLVQYGSIVFNHTAFLGYIAKDTTPAAANRRAARAAIAAGGCGEGSSCQYVLSFRNACGTLAKSTDGNRAGVGWGTSENAAGQAAIGRCTAAGGQGCKVVTTTSGRLFGLCARAGTATPTGNVSAIPPRGTTPGTGTPGTGTPPQGAAYDYGSLALNPTTYTSLFVIRYPSQAEARDAAVASCGDGCQEVLSFRNACGSLALNSDNTRAGVGWGTSENAAGQAAIGRCTAAGGQGCSVFRTRCSQAGTATPTGQPSTIPPRGTGTPGTGTPGTGTPGTGTHVNVDFSSDQWCPNMQTSYRAAFASSTRTEAVKTCKELCSIQVGAFAGLDTGDLGIELPTLGECNRCCDGI